MKKNMKKLAVGFGVFVMAVGSLMGFIGDARELESASGLQS